MTIEEAIEHAEQKAEELEGNCGQEHLQLAQWLKELKIRRKADDNLLNTLDSFTNAINEVKNHLKETKTNEIELNDEKILNDEKTLNDDDGLLILLKNVFNKE